MPSSLAWLDHDGAARDRTLRILALFQEHGTREQLSLVGIRDSFADIVFPGTSTIQTRLRYFLIISWINSWLEEDGVPPHRFGAGSRRRELSLVELLVLADEGGCSAGLQEVSSSAFRAKGAWRFRLSRRGRRRGNHHRMTPVVLVHASMHQIVQKASLHPR